MEEIIGFDALWDSAQRCKHGVIWKASVANFMLNSVREVLKLSRELNDGSYTEKPRRTFTVTAPKEREIVSIAFRDRVYQRSLNDNAIYPAIVPSLIYDNCACQKGKGTDFARNRMKAHIQKLYRKRGADIFALKLDIRHYYQTMPHELAKAVFREYLPPEVYERAAVILDSYPGDTGYNPGSQMIQIAGISVLNGVDHYIKEWMRVKHYVRYMDDMILLSDDPNYLLQCRDEIRGELQKIGFELHDEKSQIYRMRDGVMFLGFTFRLTETGKVLMLVDPKRVKAERKKLRRMANLVQKGVMTQEKVDTCYRSWREHASKGNSHRLLLRMDAFYQELW